MGFDKDAADLYQVTGEGSELYRQHIRVAQWAVKAKNAAKAKDESWQAVQQAVLERDRNYALSLLVEAHGIDQSIPALIEKLGQQKTLTLEEQRVRIDLLRQTGQYQKAIDLFTSAYGQSLDPDLRLSCCAWPRRRPGASDGERVQRLIAGDPTRTEWVEGLVCTPRKTDQPSARKLWEGRFIARNSDVNPLLLASDSVTQFGMHDLAVAATNKAPAGAPSVEDAARVRLVQFELYRRRGANVEAEATLKALDTSLPAASPYRAELADAYERIQKPQQAATTLAGLNDSPTGLNVDDRMRLAWLYDSTGRRDDALKMWRSIWDSESVDARRKLVQERMLMLATETGTLGDLAVELETKVKKGTAQPKDVSLLVSIYTKVGDSVSAIETITTASSRGGRNAKTEVESLKEQSQIYLSLAEYPDFTRVMRRLIEVDPDNKVDYLQALLLNQIEASNDASRESPDATAQLREWLNQLRKAAGDAAGAEFEAGVLDLAGFRDQALESYRRALALHPERADDHLLLADILRQGGRQVEPEPKPHRSHSGGS
jgi:tetratricopeptide (TPR) repeat protein